MRGPAAALVLACALAVAGCGPAEPTSPATPQRTSQLPTSPPAPAPTAPDSAPLTAAQVREQASTRYAGLSFVFLAAQHVDVEEQTGSAVLTVDHDANPGDTVALVAADSGSFLLKEDGSIVVVDADDVPSAGIARPVGGVVSMHEPDLLGLVADHAALSTTLTVWLTDQALLGLGWGEREGGRSLAVSPTDWARTGSEAALALTWAQIVAAEPEADVATMYDQLACHMIGAPDKETWNLEPWRPDVGPVAVVAALCNPT